tara:strand:+ start:603 stop:1136 length:534 start_codon:yes stop_codon:yes gene_type:complete
MASLTTHNQTNNHIINTQYYKNCKYLFAYYSHTSKVWNVQPRRFILSVADDTVHAQFLQSIWFNKTYKKNQLPILFVVLHAHKSISCSTIEKDMNSLKNPFPTVYDIPPYIKRHSYFSIPWGLKNKCIDEVKEKGDIKFTFRAINNPWDTLEMSLYGDTEIDKQEVIFTLPYFVCKV